MREFTVAQAIFDAHPDFRRAIVVATQVGAGRRLDALNEIWTAELTHVLAAPAARIDMLTSVWKTAYRRWGMDPDRHPPPHVALTQRFHAPRC